MAGSGHSSGNSGLAPSKRETEAETLTRLGSISAASVLLFPPVGWQRVNMGRALFESNTTFRSSIMACNLVCRHLLPQPLLEALYPSADGDAADIAEMLLARPDYTLASLFAVEYALLALLREQACEPAAVIGHSIGEYMAAVSAGVLTMPVALELVIERGRAMLASPTSGAMISVKARVASARDAIARARRRDEVVVAAFNAPESCVLAGSFHGLAAVRAALPAEVKSTPVRTEHPDHSPLMRPVAEAVLSRARALYAASPPSPPTCLWVSTVALEAPPPSASRDLKGDFDGDSAAAATAAAVAAPCVVSGESMIEPSYWALHAVRSVDFLGAVRRVADAFVAASTHQCECSRTLHLVDMGEGMLARFASEILSEQSSPSVRVQVTSLLSREEATASADAYMELARRTEAAIDVVLRPTRAAKLQAFLDNSSGRRCEMSE